MLGSMGSGLSAGQSQRIALARALFRNPPILILDEPNAFLDADGEAALLDELHKARAGGAPVLLVAHRKSVLSISARLPVIDAGKPKRTAESRVGTEGDSS